jgi:hypothetical protein
VDKSVWPSILWVNHSTQSIIGLALAVILFSPINLSVRLVKPRPSPRYENRTGRRNEQKQVKIELQFIDQVIPYAGNPRKISEPGIDKVGASIEQYLPPQFVWSRDESVERR